MSNGQAGQFISITTPLGDDTLVLRKFTGQEGISQLFNFQLELLSEKPPIRLEAIIGQNVTVSLTLTDGSKRHFNGFVSEFAQTGQDSRFTYYQAEVVPWLWFLSHTSDSRIFQNRTITEILIQIFQDFGFRDFRAPSGAPMNATKSWCNIARRNSISFPDSWKRKGFSISSSTSKGGILL